MAQFSLQQFATLPVYNTKAVVRETDVPADTFRAWERRYGIPKPQRTAGGHRLYSERDIAIVRWLRDRTAEGVNISQAVALLHNELASPPPEQPLVSNQPRNIDQVSTDLLKAFIRFDAVRAEQLLTEAFALYPFESVLIDLLQPTMVEIGEQWHRGELSVAVEHFASQFVRRKLASLLNMFDIETGRGAIVVACAPDELHDMGAQFAALFLARRGWKIIYLGPQLPQNDLLSAVRETQPVLVCLSASMTQTALRLRTVAESLRRTYPNVQIGFGGRIFNHDAALRASVPGTFLGADARELAATVERLLPRSATSIADA